MSVSMGRSLAEDLRDLERLSGLPFRDSQGRLWLLSRPRPAPPDPVALAEALLEPAWPSPHELGRLVGAAEVTEVDLGWLQSSGRLLERVRLRRVTPRMLEGAALRKYRGFTSARLEDAAEQLRLLGRLARTPGPAGVCRAGRRPEAPAPILAAVQRVFALYGAEAARDALAALRASSDAWEERRQDIGRRLDRWCELVQGVGPPADGEREEQVRRDVTELLERGLYHRLCALGTSLQEWMGPTHVLVSGLVSGLRPRGGIRMLGAQVLQAWRETDPHLKDWEPNPYEQAGRLACALSHPGAGLVPPAEARHDFQEKARELARSDRDRAVRSWPAALEDPELLETRLPPDLSVRSVELGVKYLARRLEKRPRRVRTLLRLAEALGERSWMDSLEETDPDWPLRVALEALRETGELSPGERVGVLRPVATTVLKDEPALARALDQWEAEPSEHPLGAEAGEYVKHRRLAGYPEALSRRLRQALEEGRDKAVRLRVLGSLERVRRESLQRLLDGVTLRLLSRLSARPLAPELAVAAGTLTASGSLPLLRAFLRHVADGRSFAHLPENQRWVDRAARSGVDVRRWLRGFEAEVQEVRFATERDPLQVLQMGVWFGTCLSLDSFNAHSLLANAVDVNKQVIVGRDPEGRVVARKLIGATAAGELAGYRTYMSPASEELRTALSLALQDFARECGLRPSDEATPEDLHDGGWYDDGNEGWNGEPAPETPRSDELYRRVLAGERPPDWCWCCQGDTVLALCRKGRLAAIPADRLGVAATWIPCTRPAVESALRRGAAVSGALAALPLRRLLPLVEDWETGRAADLLELAAVRDGLGPLARRLQGRAGAAAWEVARRRPIPGARSALARWRGAGDPPAPETLPEAPPSPDLLAAAVAGDPEAAAAWLSETRSAWRAWLLLALPLPHTPDLARAAVAAMPKAGVRLRWAEALPPEEQEDLFRSDLRLVEEVRVPLLLDFEAGGSPLAEALVRADDPDLCRRAAEEWLLPEALRRMPS